MEEKGRWDGKGEEGREGKKEGGEKMEKQGMTGEKRRERESIFMNPCDVNSLFMEFREPSSAPRFGDDFSFQRTPFLLVPMTFISLSSRKTHA